MIVVLVCILIVSAGRIAADDYGNEEIRDAAERFQAHLEQSGSDNSKDYLEELLNEWKKHPIHIGITGQSGVGKSTFINTIRDLRADDPQAAPVGVDETTKAIKSYPDKNNKNLVYWDLPGCGTPNFPRDTYLKRVDLNKFDHLIIITADRFTENDEWLVNEAKQRRKSFFLVRNKINVALESERQDHPSRSEQDVMTTIRNSLMLHSSGSQVPIYLISTRLNHSDAWDFPRLTADLIQKSPKIKQQSMILSLTSKRQTAIDQKVRALRQRIWITATLSAATNVIPIPGLSVAYDVVLLEREIQFYKKTLKLDIDSLTSIGDANSLVLDELKKYYKTTDDKNYYELIFGKELASFLIKKISTYAVQTVAKEVFRYIPIVGQVVSSTTSFAITFKILNDLLNNLHMAALKLIYFVELQQRSS